MDRITVVDTELVQCNNRNYIMRNILRYEELINESYDAAKVFFVDTGKIPGEVFNTIAYVDPTVDKTYLHTMCTWYIENQADIETLKDMFKRFDFLIKNGDIKDPDISRFSNFAEFQDEVKNTEITGLQSKKIYDTPGKFPNDYNR